jgi:hypothetical protein
MNQRLSQKRADPVEELRPEAGGETRMEEKEFEGLTMTQASQQPLMELDEKTYPQILNQCSKAVEQIRANFSRALVWYHYLGQVLIQYKVQGEQIKGLSRDLGPGFSPTTLYRCIEFARTYPDREAFFRDHGMQSWRSVTRILVKHSRDLHACKTKAGASEPSLSSWVAQPMTTCPYCNKTVTLSLEYTGDGNITVNVPQKEQREHADYHGKKDWPVHPTIEGDDDLSDKSCYEVH